MNKKILIFVFGIALLPFFGNSHAIGAPPPPPDGPPSASPGNGLQQKQEKLQTLITLRLVNELGLSQDQALKVSEVMKKYHMKRRDLRMKLMELNQQLRDAVNANDPKSGQLVGEIQKAKNEMDGVDDAMFREMKPMLTPQQQAKFILLMEDVRREIHQFHRGGPGGPPSGPGQEGNPPPKRP